jgi:toxin HigB-1
MLRQKFGPAMAAKINLRLQQMRAAPTLAIFKQVHPRCHALDGDRDGEFAADLLHPQRLIFRPNHEPPPHDEFGGLDLGNVTTIKILEIEDYHGKRKRK